MGVQFKVRPMRRRGLGSLLDLISGAGDSASADAGDATIPGSGYDTSSGDSGDGDVNVGSYAQGAAAAVTDYGNAVLPSSSGGGSFLDTLYQGVQSFGSSLSSGADSTATTAATNTSTRSALTSGGGGLAPLPPPNGGGGGGSTTGGQTMAQQIGAKNALYLEAGPGGIPVWAYALAGVAVLGGGIYLATRKKGGH